MPPVTPSAISICPPNDNSCERLLRWRVLDRDLLDLALLDFLHRRPRRLVLGLHFRRAALQQLLGPGSRDDDVLELVHTCSFPANEPAISDTTPAIAVRRDRSARTIARRRSTHASSWSLTTT